MNTKIQPLPRPLRIRRAEQIARISNQENYKFGMVAAFAEVIDRKRFLLRRPATIRIV
jgi:hypothetical protein